jgi:hypothetical protein
MFQRLPGSESVSLVVSNLFLESFLNFRTWEMQISKHAAFLYKRKLKVLSRQKGGGEHWSQENRLFF